MVLDRHDDLLGRRLDADDHLAAVGAELDGIVEEVDDHLPEPILRPTDRRHLGRHVRPKLHALALGEQPESLDRGHREPPEVDLVEHDQRTAGLDPRQVEQLLDHLDEVVGLDLDLADPVAHPGRDRLAGAVSFADEGLGQQADGGQRRAQLVRQVVDELGPDPLEATELGDVLHDQPDALDRRSPGPHDERRAIVATKGQLAARRPRLAGGLDDGLDRGVNERLDRAPPDEGARSAPEELVGRGIGDVHPEIVVEANDADAEDVEQHRPIALDLSGLPLGALRPFEQLADLLLDVDPVRIDRLTLRVAGTGEQLANPVERPAADDGQGDRHAEDDSLDDDERDHQRVHPASIAHDLGAGSPACDALLLRAIDPATANERSL